MLDKHVEEEPYWSWRGVFFGKDGENVFSDTSNIDMHELELTEREKVRLVPV